MPAKRKQTSLPDTPTDVYHDILLSAKKLFRQKGYTAVSINDIVTAAGITKPTLYYYFGDKESLYTEVLIHMMACGSHFVTVNVQNGQTCRENLLALATGYFENSPTSIATLLRDAREHLSALNFQKIVDANQYYMIAPFERLFQVAIQQKEVQPNDVRDLATIFVGLLDVFTSKRTSQSGRHFDYHAKAQTVVGLFMDGVGLKS